MASVVVYLIPPMYLSFGLALTILYLYTIESFAFEFQVPLNTTIFAPTLLNWTWKSGDPENIRILWAKGYDGNSGGCPAGSTNIWKNVVIWKINLGEPDLSGTRRGSEWFNLGSPGQVQLCAYSHEKQQDKLNITSVANSTLITVDPPNLSQPNATPIITTTISGVSTNAPSQANENHTKNRGLTGAGIGVIVLGIIVILGLLIGLLYLVYRRRRHRKRLDEFHKDRMVLAAQVPRIASPESVIPKKHVSQTITLSDSDHSQSVPFYTFPGEKDGQKSYGEGSLAPLRSMNV